MSDEYYKFFEFAIFLGAVYYVLHSKIPENEQTVIFFFFFLIQMFAGLRGYVRGMRSRE